MALMIVLVPNHMGVFQADNRWWLDVLENGSASRYADYFDIDWDPLSDELRGKVLLPILADQYGTVLERGDLELRFDADAGAFSLWYFEHRMPIRASEYQTMIGDDLDRSARAVIASDVDASLKTLSVSFGALRGFDATA